MSHPPPDGADFIRVHSNNSYQHTLTIQQLDSTTAPHNNTTASLPRYSALGSTTANTDLQPNTGRTNRYDYDIFGLTLAELLERLRWSVVASTAWLLLVIFISWWRRPRKIVWTLLLAVLDGLVLVAVLARGLDERTTNSSSSDGGIGIWIERILVGQQPEQQHRETIERVLHMVQWLDEVGKQFLEHPVGVYTHTQRAETRCRILVGRVSAFSHSVFPFLYVLLPTSSSFSWEKLGRC